MKKLIALFFRSISSVLAGIDGIFVYAFSNEKLVFCYHNVSSTPSGFETKFGLNHSPEVFKLQLDLLGKYFEFGNPCELTDSAEKAKVYLTFDDGYQGVLDEGVAILEERGIPSLHFLNMGVIDGEEPFWVSASVALQGSGIGQGFLNKPSDDWIGKYRALEKIDDFAPRFVSQDSLKKLDCGNLVYFGNHFYNHINAASVDQRTIEELYQKNEEKLKQFGNYIGYFAYPFGQPQITFNNDTDGIIKDLAPKAIFTAHPQPNKLDENFYFNRYSLSPQLRTHREIKTELLYQKLRSFFLSIF